MADEGEGNIHLQTSLQLVSHNQPHVLTEETPTPKVSAFGEPLFICAWSLLTPGPGTYRGLVGGEFWSEGERRGPAEAPAAPK